MVTRIFMLTAAILLLVGCGGSDDGYTEEGGGGGSGVGRGAVTGILLNLQRPEGEDLAKTGSQWQVLSPSGAIFFTYKNCPTGVLGPIVAFKRADALNDTNLRKMGENYREIRIAKATFDEERKIPSYHLDDATMREIAGIGNFMKLLQDGKIVLLFGRDGK